MKWRNQIISAIVLGGVLSGSALGAPKVFYVYNDYGSKYNHFSPSGWMGDTGDLRVDENSTKNPQSGTSCIQISYSARRSEGAGWAAIYWLHPSNNWGDKPGGYRLSAHKKLTFWARGSRGGETLTFKAGGVKAASAPGDSDAVSMEPVALTKEWKQYTIDLSGRNMSYIIGGFCLAASADDNPHGFTIYLDEIRYE